MLRLTKYIWILSRGIYHINLSSSPINLYGVSDSPIEMLLTFLLPGSGDIFHLLLEIPSSITLIIQN